MSGLLLVDGNGLAWKVTTGVKNTGHETVVLYQGTRFLLELQASFPGWFVVLVFDGGGSVFREKLYPAYKGNRPMTEDRKRVRHGIDIAKQALQSFGRPYIEVKGCEADDVISILAIRAREAGIGAVIVSDDTDLYQCLGGTVRQMHLRENKILTCGEALAEWGGSVDRYLFWKALRGDPGDNVKGVSGIGEKHAHEIVALARGRPAWIQTPQAKALLEGKSWAKALWKPEGQRQLSLCYRLIRTARKFEDLQEFGETAKNETTRVLGRHKVPLMIPQSEWLAFVRRYDAFPLLGDRSMVECLYGFRVAS